MAFLAKTQPKEQGYRLEFARSTSERELAFRLRYEVFNVELKEGLLESTAARLDRDQFDDVCDHLLVFEQASDTVIGTYRLQSGSTAANHLGYYCATEFDLSPFEPVRAEVLELGRACIHRDHRSMTVLSLLWRGIAEYTRRHRARYLIGCSSVTSQDPQIGQRLYRQLSEQHLVRPEFRTIPLPECRCDEMLPGGEYVKPPKLLRTYLEIGAKICGPPAIDRAFRTIDFLTFLDLHELPSLVRRRYDEE